MTRHIAIRAQTWPLKQHFAIARDSKISADVICADITECGVTGRGEAVPYARYGESVETVSASIEDLRPALEDGLEQSVLGDALPPGAARNALDCAMWDLRAKQTGQPVWQLAGLEPPRSLITAFTITLDKADIMAEKARQARGFPLLKIKLGGADGLLADIARLNTIVDARPDAQFIVDANEGWVVEDVARYRDQLAKFGVQFFEQPVPAARDHALQGIKLPFCADESVHDSASLDSLSPAYQWVNIKLDKAGGLSEALALVKAARARGLYIMVGCMVATSLSMAPAFILGQLADLIDLDGSLWLDKDREGGMKFRQAQISEGESGFWGN